eukprot:SAG22_NODE_693_length_7872_cov_13.111797_11_plen_124_part_00
MPFVASRPRSFLTGRKPAPRRHKLSFRYGIGEKVRQRVDEAGHVNLSDLEARKLSRTKSFNTIIIFVGIVLSLIGRNVFGSMMGGAAIAALCRVSELLSMEEAPMREKLTFLASTVAFQSAGV